MYFSEKSQTQEDQPTAYITISSSFQSIQGVLHLLSDPYVQFLKLEDGVYSSDD